MDPATAGDDIILPDSLAYVNLSTCKVSSNGQIEVVL